MFVEAVLRDQPGLFGPVASDPAFSYHPLLCFLDNIGEALAGLLREGRSGSNTTANHITVLDEALAQIPDAHRHGTPILLRSDSAGSSHGFLAHIRSLREQHHLDIRFSTPPDGLPAPDSWSAANARTPAPN